MVVTGNGIVGAPKSVDNRGSLKLLGPTVTKVVLELPPQKNNNNSVPISSEGVQLCPDLIKLPSPVSGNKLFHLPSTFLMMICLSLCLNFSFTKEANLGGSSHVIFYC